MFVHVTPSQNRNHLPSPSSSVVIVVAFFIWRKTNTKKKKKKKIIIIYTLCFRFFFLSRYSVKCSDLWERHSHGCEKWQSKMKKKMKQRKKSNSGRRKRKEKVVITFGADGTRYRIQFFFSLCEFRITIFDENKDSNVARFRHRPKQNRKFMNVILIIHAI